MTKKIRGFTRKDFKVATRPDPVAALNKYREHKDDLANNQLRWEIYDAESGKKTVFGSINYLRYSVDHKPESILCELSVNDIYAREGEKPNLVQALHENIATLTEFVKLQHPRVKELVFYRYNLPPGEFIENMLGTLAKAQGTEVKKKLCAHQHSIFNGKLQQHLPQQTKQAALALQLKQD